MLVNINRGFKGIKEYLEEGRKKDRDFSRFEADERVVLQGDLDVTDTIIDTVESKSSRYYHVVLSFKEDYVSKEDMQKALDEFEKFAFSAYEKDEYNLYAEAHYPKLKSYFDKKTGELKIRRPHMHIVIPEKNLLNNTKIKPLGFIKKQSLSYINAFTEKFNMEEGFASPKENHSNLLKSHNITLREEILSSIMDKKNKINNYEDFENFLKENYTTRTRNEFSDVRESYFNIKPDYHQKGTNLNDYVFSKDFINKTFTEKKEFLAASLEDEKYLEKDKNRKIDSSKLKEYSNMTKFWHELKAKEIKYINQNTKFYKETYKFMSNEEKMEVLKQKEKNFYLKHNIQQEIENDLKDIKLDDIKDLKLDSHIANNKKSDNLVSQMLKEEKEEKELEKIDFKGVLTSNIYHESLKNKGVLENKLKLDENGNIYKNNDSQERISLKEFLVEEMNMIAVDIHNLQNSISRIEENYIESNIKTNKKGKNMSISVNIKTNEKNRDKVDYLQIGEVDRVGKFTGFVYDQADKIKDSSATLFIVKDKVVDFEEFKKLDNYKELDNKMKELVNTDKEQKYSTELRMNYVKENLSLTSKGQSYANSQYNFKELQPIEIGISKFENSRPVDKNIFTKAKEFVLENYYLAKDKIQLALTSKRDLAASNVALAYELKSLKAELDQVKTYQEALEQKAEKLNEMEKSKSKEQPQEEKKQHSFKEVYKQVKSLGDKIEDAKDIKELAENAPDFADKRDTALELLANLKDKPELIKLDENSIDNLDLSDAKAVNMMASNDIPVKSKNAVSEFIDIVKSVKDMSINHNLDFESQLAATLVIVKDKFIDKSQAKQKETKKDQEQER